MKLRTANLLGALATAVADRLAAASRHHPNQNDTSLAALNLLALFEGCSNNDLARALDLSHSAAVRLVDKLENEGLVIRRAAEDRRTVALHLTNAGKLKAEAGLKARCVPLGDLVDHLSDAQRQALDDITSTLLQHLTDSPVAAAHICRLCDHVACPDDVCPVHNRALEHLVTAG